VQPLQHGGIDQIVDERTHHFVALRKNSGFAVEMLFLEMQLIAMRGIRFSESFEVVLTAAE
jgi:hypothetical protein